MAERSRSFKGVLLIGCKLDFSTFGVLIRWSILKVSTFFLGFWASEVEGLPGFRSRGVSGIRGLGVEGLGSRGFGVRAREFRVRFRVYGSWCEA